MNEQEQRAVDILRELGGWPAVSFFEGGPRRCIVRVLSEMGLDPHLDTFGNVIARYVSDPLTSDPPLALVAHMDHPGFELMADGADGAVARVLGGVPEASLTRPTPVLVLGSDGERIPAEVVPPARRARGGDRLVGLRWSGDSRASPPAPVVFDLADFVLDDDAIRMRALDDLGGCAAILAALDRVVRDSSRGDVYVVFTRAEEVGLIGARLLAEAETLPRETLVVSVECSAVLPGVEQGGGPVIRTGDAASTFDDEAERVLIAARNSIHGSDPGFRCQRQLMSAGTCEATAFAAHGHRATGLAFPLGNYHNATTRIADPDGRIAEEFIRLSDYLGGVELMAEAVSSVGLRDETPMALRMRQVPEEMRRRAENKVHTPDSPPR